MHTKNYCVWYTVWNRATEELLCSGPPAECARILGFSSENSFLSSIRHCTTRGTEYKYDILREVVKRDEIYG